LRDTVGKSFISDVQYRIKVTRGAYMESDVRWGILSTAAINQELIGPMKEVKGSSLIAVASRNHDKAKTYAEKNAIPKFYESYEALLKDPNIDAVYIPLPNSLHCDWVVNAANEKKHVLCEKPIVTDLDQLEQIKTAATANSVTVFEAFMYLHHPQMRAIRDTIRNGRIGSIHHISSWLDYYLPLKDSKNIRLNPSLGGGSIWDVGVYTNSLSIVIADNGTPKEAHCYQTPCDSGVDIRTYAQMKFENGTVAQFSASIRSPFRVGAHVVGDHGALLIDDPWKPGLQGKKSTFSVIGQNGEREVITLDAHNPYADEVETMVSCILDGSEPVVSLEQSGMFLKTILALKKSAEEKTVVFL
jgi:xylose dehydrogenase (NAD/NADP)